MQSKFFKNCETCAIPGIFAKGGCAKAGIFQPRIKDEKNGTFEMMR